MKYNIEAKASMHVGKKYSLKHNLREYDANKWNTDGHIQSDRSHLNERLTHTELRDFFQKTFGAAIDQYNEKNREKHPDRMTSVDDYYNKYKGHAQECIMQMGDHENYMELIKLVGQEKADYIHKQFLTRAYKNWLKDNPSLKVFSATIHMDEIKDGTPHIHLDFLPVAESSRGLTVKVSMDGAMKKLGYDRKTKAKDGENDSYKETPYRRWLSQQRERVEILANEYVHLIPSQPFTKRRRQETWQWRAQQKEALVEDVKQLSETKVQAEKDIEQLRTEYQQYRDLKVDKEDLSQKIKVKAGHFGKNDTVVMDKADFDKIQEQSAAYVANYDKIKFADERSSDLDEREKKLNEAEKSVEYIKNGLEKQRQEVFAAASKKKNEAESLIREYEEKVALQNGYLSRAAAKYREQVDLNERYEISQRLLSEERKKTETLRSEIAGIDKQHKQEISEFLDKNQALSKDLILIKKENDTLESKFQSLTKNFMILLLRFAAISQHLKYVMKSADLSDFIHSNLEATKQYIENTCGEINLSPEKQKSVDAVLMRNEALPKINEKAKVIAEELKQEREHSNYHGMSL